MLCCIVRIWNHASLLLSYTGSFYKSRNISVLCVAAFMIIHLLVAVAVFETQDSTASLKPGSSQSGHPYQTQKLQIRRRTKQNKTKKIQSNPKKSQRNKQTRVCICLVTVFNTRFHSQERDLVWI